MAKKKQTKPDETANETANEIKPFYYIEQKITHYFHHYYLSSEIDEPGLYVEMIHKIKSAKSDEVIFLHLNSNGGHLGTGVQLINAIQSSEGHVIASLESQACSLITLIFLAADEFIVHDNCVIMFHTFSGQIVGKGHEQQSGIEATAKWFDILAKKLCIPFLTIEEFDRIQRGEDLYFHSDEIRQRLKKMVKAIKSKTSKKKTKVSPQQEHTG